MSLRQLFSSIQPKLNILFEEQKDVSITTTIVVPVSSSFMSSPFLSQQFQQNFELFIRSFFEKLFLSETVESVVESRSDFKEEITTEINPDETQFSEVLEKGNVHLKFSGQTKTWPFDLHQGQSSKQAFLASLTSSIERPMKKCSPSEKTRCKASGLSSRLKKTSRNS